MRQPVAVVVAPFSGKKLDLTGPLNTNHLRENWLLLFVGICNTSSSFRTYFHPKFLLQFLDSSLTFMLIWNSPMPVTMVFKVYSYLEKTF